MASEDRDGRELTCRFVILAIGCSLRRLCRDWKASKTSRPLLPHHYWPHDPVDLAGKKVAVIGTGATGIN